MDLKKLATVSFDKNVGAGDRVFRLTSGAALVGAGWFVGLPSWAAIGMAVLGVMLMVTGVSAKCSIYYVFGHSTCPTSGAARG